MNLIENIAQSYYDCIHNQVRTIMYQKKDWPKSKETDSEVFVVTSRPANEMDVELFSAFSQMWGSTALGFGGIGGAAMTNAYTTIYRHEHNFYVYFGGRFAYVINKPNGYFYEDLKNMNLTDVKGKFKYE